MENLSILELVLSGVERLTVTFLYPYHFAVANFFRVYVTIGHNQFAGKETVIGKLLFVACCRVVPLCLLSVFPPFLKVYFGIVMLPYTKLKECCVLPGKSLEVKAILLLRKPFTSKLHVRTSLQGYK